MTNLAEQYRPRYLSDIKGADLVVTMLKSMVENESLPNCMMFTGAHGVGKTSAARALVQELNRDTADPTSYIEIDAASHNGVDDVRKLQELLRYSHSGKWRVLVVDEAHGLSTAAFNALLKILEDPPKNTLFVLVTTRPDLILDTVRSRAMVFRFPSLSISTIAYRLNEVIKEEGIDIPLKVLVQIAQVAEGSMRDALVLLNQVRHHPDPTVEAVNTLVGRNIDFTEFMYALQSGSINVFREAVDQLFGQTYDTYNMMTGLYNKLKEFFDLGEITTSQFLKSAEIVWNMRRISTSNDHVARTQMEAALFALFLDSFWDGQEVQEKTQQLTELSTEEAVKMVS